MVEWRFEWKGLIKSVDLSWKNSDLKTLRYKGNHGLEREEEGETDPTRKKPSPVKCLVDRFSEARETSSWSRKLVGWLF